MSDTVFAESIYIKRTTGKLGNGATARECVMETLWFPYRTEDGYVELYPVMDNLQSILKIIERIPVEDFKAQYSVKDDSRDAYLNLKKMVG